MAEASSQPIWRDLAPSQQEAWFGLLRFHATAIRELDEELESAHGLPLSSYDVLVQLARGPVEGRQMWELAEAVVLTRSGLTRLVERLEREGLVERCRDEDDARRVNAQITRQGRARLREASATHVAGIRRVFLGKLSSDQVEMLARAWRQLLE